METELDNDMKAILEALRRYPDGISVNRLYESLKDDRGRYLMSKPTYAKKLQKLKDMGIVIEEVDGEWKRGKKKILKLRDSSKIIAEIFSKIRIYKELFRNYLEVSLSNLSEKGSLESVLNILQKINLSRLIIFNELSKIRDEVFFSEFSDSLKRELILETFEAEKEINQAFFDMILKYKDKSEAVKLFYEIYQKGQEYAMNLKQYSEKGKSFLESIMSLASREGFGEEFKLAFELFKSVLALKPEDTVISLDKLLPEIKSLFEELEKVNPLTIISEVESELEELKKKLEVNRK